MKRTLTVAMCTAGLLLGACGGSEVTGSSSAEVSREPIPEVSREPIPEVPHAPTPDGAVSGGEPMELRLLGVDAEGYEAVRLPVRDVRVTAGGQVLLVERVATEVDLARTGHAALVGRFMLPPGVETVDVVVEFGDAGALASGGSSQVVDLRTPPLRFTTHADWLAEHHHAVVHLSVARSMVRSGSGLLMLPNLSVYH